MSTLHSNPRHHATQLSNKIGEQTKLAVYNFSISGETLPPAFIRALVCIKLAAAKTHQQMGLMQTEKAQAIVHACQRVLENFDPLDFPVDVFQTGSGTSTNMNVNEVIAHLANQELHQSGHTQLSVHPNDDVNQSQSSNDTIPSALHLSAASELQTTLRPAMEHLIDVLAQNIAKFEGIVKTGRTHLMDALPIRASQELSGWQMQITNAMARIDATLPRLCQLALGGTAVGTGVNAPTEFAHRAVHELSALTALQLTLKPNYFEALSCQDTVVELSGQLKVLAVALMKIANDLRWMNSGPYAGLSEIQLAALQPGSSIMPGKVNPVIPEAVCMASAQVIGNDTCITVAGQSGQFQLNVMLPVMAKNALHSIGLMANACTHLADKALSTLTYNEDVLNKHLTQNPILITALNTKLGYEHCAKIAKEAYRTGEPIVDVAERLSDIPRSELKRLLDPINLT